MKSLVTKTLTLALTVLLLAFSLNAQINAEQEAKIDSLFKNWNNKNSPGAAVGVIQDGRLVFSKGYGMADLEHDIPITPSSVFYLASVSKQFVTMSILLLEEQGKLSIDDEIQKHLPDFPKYKDPLTIRHFIHHTSGVRDSLSLWNLAGKDIYDQIEKDAMYDLIKRQKELNFKPGEKYLYSNACYFMLALIVEKASGKSIKEFAEEHMFKPLGMKNTHFHDDQYHIVKNRVFSYLPSDKGFRNLIMRFDLVGSGGLYSNIEDLVLWDQNFYDNKLGKRRPELIRKMESNGVLNNGKSAGYAFGLSNGTHKGLRTVGHGGALAGYRTYSIRYPDQNFSVIVLSNVSNFNPGSKARNIAEIFLKDEFKKAPVTKSKATGTSKKVPAKPAKIKLAPEQLKRFVAHYWNDTVNISVNVFLKEGVLKFHRAGNPVYDLTPLADNTFKVDSPQLDIVVKFGNKSNKRVFDAVVDQSQSIQFKHYEPANYSKQELAKFAGSYFSDEVNVYYRLKIEKGALILYVNDKKKGPLRPIMKNLFLNGQIGKFQFHENSTGEVAGFKLDAGRVKNLRFRRQ